MAVPGFNGNGIYVRKYSWRQDAANGINILSSRHDEEDDGLAAGLSNCLTRDGQSQPMADLPMNGKKLINLGDPVNPKDAANKAYADSVRNFTTAISIQGVGAQGRIKFSGSGVVGSEFTVTDIGFGVREGVASTSWPRFVWNTKADFSGTDMMVLTDQGQLGLFSTPPIAARNGSFFAEAITAAGNFMVNAYLTAASAWVSWRIGWAAGLNVDIASGVVQILRSTAKTTAANGAITWEALLNFAADKSATFAGYVKATGVVYASDAYLNTDGNTVGPAGTSIWLNFGTGHVDAYSAIINRIENRCLAFINAYAVTDTRMAGFVNVTVGGGPRPDVYEYAGYVVTGMQRSGNDSYTFRWRQPQRHIPNAGWAVAFNF